jgi:hypothetical protein
MPAVTSAAKLPLQVQQPVSQCAIWLTTPEMPASHQPLRTLPKALLKNRTLRQYPSQPNPKRQPNPLLRQYL